MPIEIRKLGLIAGNGRFPFLVLAEAVRRQIPVVVAAIKEETAAEIDEWSRPGSGVEVHWIALGHLGKLLKLFRESGVDKAIMAGQVKHNRIFSRESLPSLSTVVAGLPDWKMLQVLLSVPRKNTAALIGAIADAMEREGVMLLDSTCLLGHLLPEPGVLTRRKPTESEWRDIGYGTEIAREVARLDIGQTVVVKDQAVVAVEAMEGTDETIRRAAEIAGGRPLTVVKVARPNQDMRFDVPVIGPQTLTVLEKCRVTALAIEAGKTLIFDRSEFTAGADRLKISVVAQ